MGLHQKVNCSGFADKHVWAIIFDRSIRASARIQSFLVHESGESRHRTPQIHYFMDVWETKYFGIRILSEVVPREACAQMEATNSQLRLLASTNAEMQKQMYEFKTQSTDLTTTNNQLSLKTYSLEVCSSQLQTADKPLGSGRGHKLGIPPRI